MVLNADFIYNMTKIVDLRPDKELINTNFEKYQFSSDSIPIKDEKHLETEILRLESNSSQDSWLEARLFAFHNHLFKNPFDATCWFIDKNGGVWKYKTNGSLNLIYTSEKIVKSNSDCIYNPSIAFASENISVVCSGSGCLEFLTDIGGCIKSFTFDNLENAVILDARYLIEVSKIIVVLYQIDQDKGKRYSKLIFLYYNYENNNSCHSIKLYKKQTLRAKGAVEQVYIEKKGKFAYVTSQDQVEFDYDSVSPIKKEDVSSDCQVKIPKYCWSQDEDSITVYIKVPDKYTDVTTKVEATPTSILISVGDLVLLNGQTSNRLEPELTTWKRKSDTLEVELPKFESNLMWSELLKGDTGGEYLPNEALAAEIHSKLSHLCSDQLESSTQGQPTIGFNSDQLEECDLSGAENILQRVHFDSHTTTHMAMFGSSNRILFAEKQLSGLLLCLRHDHDGCVWVIEEEEDDNNWDPKHTHTFPGFGYVEASKSNKKFCVSPQDGSYIAIVEHTRHIFLYEKPEVNGRVAKQRIVDFGSDTSPILGSVAVDKNLIILTKNTLYQLQVY